MSLSDLLSTTGSQEVGTRLVAEMGGYLRNTVREAQLTCQVCATPVSPRYDLCRRCDQDRHQFCEELADLVVPVCYGIKARRRLHRRWCGWLALFPHLPSRGQSRRLRAAWRPCSRGPDRRAAVVGARTGREPVGAMVSGRSQAARYRSLCRAAS